MLKIALCDDELSVLNEIGVLLDEYRVEKNQEIEYTAFNSPLELLADIEKGISFDILFLDVIMPGANGIRTAEEIRQYDKKMKIIFLTSSSEFAVQSYMVNAFFYQIKPLWKDGFFRIMDSVILECEKEEQYSLILRCKSGITRIDLEKLQYCEVMGRVLLFHLSDGTVLEKNGRLDELCEQLSQYGNFFRPHRSFLINMKYIQNISSKKIIMTDLAEVPIPHGKYSEIKNTYLEYAFSRRQVIL